VGTGAGLWRFSLYEIQGGQWPEGITRGPASSGGGRGEAREPERGGGSVPQGCGDLRGCAGAGERLRCPAAFGRPAGDDLLAGAPDPGLIPDRLGGLADDAVGAKDEEAVEGAGEPAVVGDGEYGALIGL
jgi:hypothetical protein